MLEPHINSQKKKKVLYIDDPLRLGVKIEVKDICPSCHSLHITKSHCESCGLQFWIDIIGEPFGARSFFTLKDDFSLELSRMDYIHWKLSIESFKKKSEVQRYLRHSLKRYRDLIQFFSQLEEHSIESDQLRLFIYETKELMHEYNKFKGDLSALFIPLQSASFDSSLAMAVEKELSSFLNQMERWEDHSSNGQSPKRGFSSWTLLKRGFLFEALASIGAVTLASYLVMRFLVS